MHDVPLRDGSQRPLGRAAWLLSYNPMSCLRLGRMHDIVDQFRTATAFGLQGHCIWHAELCQRTTEKHFTCYSWSRGAPSTGVSILINNRCIPERHFRKAYQPSTKNSREGQGRYDTVLHLLTCFSLFCTCHRAGWRTNTPLWSCSRGQASWLRQWDIGFCQWCSQMRMQGLGMSGVHLIPQVQWGLASQMKKISMESFLGNSWRHSISLLSTPTTKVDALFTAIMVMLVELTVLLSLKQCFQWCKDAKSGVELEMHCKSSSVQGEGITDLWRAVRAAKLPAQEWLQFLSNPPTQGGIAAVPVQLDSVWRYDELYERPHLNQQHRAHGTLNRSSLSIWQKHLVLCRSLARHLKERWSARSLIL